MGLVRAFSGQAARLLFFVLLAAAVVIGLAPSGYDSAVNAAGAADEGGGPYNIHLPLVVMLRDDLMFAESNLAVDSVSAGYAHACALRPGGEPICWGLDSSGQATPLPGVYTLLASGSNHTCGLLQDGSVKCWGDDTYGQSSPPEGVFTRLAAGGYHTCGVRDDGSLACWGWNAFNQLDNIPAGVFTQVSAGNFHTCALRDDGSLACWGWNVDNQTAAPAGVFTQVSAGGSHSCAVAASGELLCWGSNTSQQTDVPTGLYRGVSAGGFHTCAIRDDGTLACWGGNGFGQLNEIPAGIFRTVSAGGQHTCAVRSGGTMACWGWNRYGQSFPPSGVEISTGSAHACAVRVDGSLSCWGDDRYGQSDPPDGAYLDVAAGSSHTCAVDTGGRLVCWGSDYEGQASPPEGTFFETTAGESFSCGLDLNGAVSCWGTNGAGQADPPAGLFTQVSAGGSHACALTPAGGITCWGANEARQSVVPPGTYTQVSAGGRHTCALNQLGQLACWGSDDRGQSQVEAGTFSQVSAGRSHSCAVRADGTLLCWGDNTFGQAQAPEGVYSQASAGGNQSCAVRLDGTLTCWGAQQAAPQITVLPETLPDGQVGQPYSQAVTASGGTPPHTFTVIDGSLPPGFTLSADGMLNGTPEESGAYAFTIQAADSADPAFAGQRSYTLDILAGPSDTTPPVITPRVTGEKGEDGWYIGKVKVEWRVEDPESEILWTSGCETVTLEEDTTGKTLTCSAASAGGEASRSVKIKIDQTPPSLNPEVVPDPVYLHGEAEINYHAADDTAGLANVKCDRVVTDQVGPYRITCIAEDKAGNETITSAKYYVIYKFVGFFPPVANYPAFNKAQAGDTILFKWTLFDANDQPVNDAGAFQVSTVQIRCPDVKSEALETDGLLIEHDCVTCDARKYYYKWETGSELAGTCQKLIIDLGEGDPYRHFAQFDFR